ncbi:MAG: PQQ-binding-like beta-propeller repeat protein, partial [Pirellulaceae bacterium]
MTRSAGRKFALISTLGVILGSLLGGQDVWAQRNRRVIESPPTDFSTSVDLQGLQNESRNLLTQTDQLLEAEAWQEAISLVRKISGDHGDQLVAAGQIELGEEESFEYFIDLRTHLRKRLVTLAHFEPEFLAAYRRQVDPIAIPRIEAAIAAGDVTRLQEVVQEYFLSSTADQALFRLGDLLLEQGRLSDARLVWERIATEFRVPADPEQRLLAFPGQPLWLAVDGLDWERHQDYLQRQLAADSDETSPLSYPDSGIPLSDVWARLALASWLEGSRHRAEVELEILRRFYPAATGTMGGREVVLAEFLARMLESELPAMRGSPRDGDWPTFAGDFSRTKIATADAVSPNYKQLWEVRIESQELTKKESLSRETSLLAEDADSLLSTHPVVIGSNVFIQDHTRVRGFRLEDGKPAFPSTDNEDFDPENLERGRFNPGDAGELRGQREGVFGRRIRDRVTNLNESLGAPRFTLSAKDQLLVARRGDTVPSLQANPNRRTRRKADLLIFNLRQEGKLLQTISPTADIEDNWEFEGTGVSDGRYIYCGVTKGGIREETAIACYEVETGSLVWRRSISTTEPYGVGMVSDGNVPHQTHNLLTLEQGVLYYNTNRGVVTALDATSGRFLWLTRYPRKTLRTQTLAEANVTLQRDLNPCIVTRGMVITMPMDSDRIFALDAATGQLVWQTVPEGINATHLLGATEEDLLVSGEHLFWIHLESGKIRAQYPTGTSEPGSQPVGYGRGVIADDKVYWPTRKGVHVLETKLEGTQAKQAIDPINLFKLGFGGGNVLV